MGLSRVVRNAPVIGNGAHTAVSPLKNPANDVADMAAAPKGPGFQVDPQNNVGLDAMMNAVARVEDRPRAEVAGQKQADLLQTVNGKPVPTMADFYRRLNEPVSITNPASP